jgi:hypothetical protein
MEGVFPKAYLAYPVFKLGPLSRPIFSRRFSGKRNGQQEMPTEPPGEPYGEIARAHPSYLSLSQSDYEGEATRVALSSCLVLAPGSCPVLQTRDRSPLQTLAVFLRRRDGGDS